jgi:hypothetical protein
VRSDTGSQSLEAARTPFNGQPEGQLSSTPQVKNA